MTRLRVEASRSYDIVIEKGALDKLGEYIVQTMASRSAVVVTDSNVAPLYLDRVMGQLKKSRIEAVSFIIPAGEKSKNPEELFSLLEFMAENHITRSDMVIALGGGVVGDLAGFAAAVFLRGVHLVQIPTTLLAAVDSSVGGKTAVDLRAGKNLAGAFYQPELVICDYETFDTLDIKTFRDGCAEVIKYAVLSGGELADILGECADSAGHPGSQLQDTPDAAPKDIKTILMGKPDVLEGILAMCVKIKRDIVHEDEFDRGQRQLLNLGHTIGHAVEMASDFKITHGSAVSIGLKMISDACLERGICSSECHSRITGLLTGFGLPLTNDFEAKLLYDIMLSDKKRGGEYITLVLPHEFGCCELRKVSLEELKGFVGLI